MIPQTQWDLIDWIRRRARRTAGPRRGVTVDTGDDCAEIRVRSGRILISTDGFLEGVHFTRREATPRQAGYKAMGASLSDIAAMGGRATAAVCAVCLPKGPGGLRLGQEIDRGLEECAGRYSVPVVGGHVATWAGPIALAVTVLGEAAGRGPLLRSGARPGDALLVTGALGGSRLGRHLRPSPRLAEGGRLARRYRIHAMIDLSDGLAQDLGHLLKESGVGAMLEAAAIPVHPDAVRLSRTSGRPPLEHALSDGEDYELLFTAPPGEAERILRDRSLGAPVRRIGTIARSRRLLLQAPDGRTRPLSMKGFTHVF